ncbi:MAG TPA: hypothetical protein VL967_13190, partial [Terracidiphilus sp.]|nr:hypothetical protein [Terracidiphilus sp.]
MRFTIERIRTLVLAAGVLLLAALAFFLVSAKWKSLLNRRDMPQRLARDIQQEANGFTFVHTYGAHSKFRIHASREVQMRDNRILLHQVQIDLYGEDGSRVDQIAGDTFDYDQKSGLAIAEGPVEMVLTRPPAAGAGSNGKDATATASQQIHLKTSGVTFDQHTGMVATAQRVDFTIRQGSGSAVGALYDSQNGYLTLDHAVQLTTQRGGRPVEVEAQHAEFDRGAMSCVMQEAKTEYRGGEAKAAQAKILFRADGTAEQLDATGGFALENATGGRLTAPTAEMVFSEHSEPESGRLEGGVTMDSVTADRTMHGSSPTAVLAFRKDGHLRQAHLERGVSIASEETSGAGEGQDVTQRVTKTWRSPVADVEFEDAGNGRMEVESIHGTGGVVITSESRHGDGAALPSKMTADEVTGTFGEGSALQELTGTGHAGIEETTAKGARQTASGDRLEVSFVPAAKDRNEKGREQGSAKAGSKGAGKQGAKGQASEGANGARMAGAADVQSAELDGQVVLFEQPAAKPGSQELPAPIRATAGKAVYEGTGQWLHLTVNPRVEDGGLM